MEEKAMVDPVQVKYHVNSLRKEIVDLELIVSFLTTYHKQEGGIRAPLGICGNDLIIPILTK